MAINDSERYEKGKHMSEGDAEREFQLVESRKKSPVINKIVSVDIRISGPIESKTT